MKKTPIIAIAPLLVLASCGPTGSESSSVPSSSDESSSSTALTSDELKQALTKQEGFCYSGTLTITDVLSVAGSDSSDIRGCISGSEYYMSEVAPTYDSTLHYHRDEDGYLTVPTMMRDNTVEDVIQTDIDSSTLEEYNLKFDDFFHNPWNDIADGAFKEEDGKVRVEIPEESGLYFGYVMTGYTDLAPEAFEFVRQGGAIHGSMIVPLLDYVTSKIEVSFEFTVLTLDELSIPELAPYEPSESQSELERAFESLKGMNYTVSLVDDDKTANNADVKVDMKVTDGLILVKQDGENPYGYIKTGEGEMESFAVDDDGVVRGTALPFEGTVASLIEADYSTSASLFRPVEGNPGTYLLAPEATSYAKYNDPAYPIDTSIEMANPGTFVFSITEDGFKISYDYYYAFGAAVYDGTVAIAITEVGTTQAEYTLDDLVEFVPPASWEELGATASISPWLAGHPEVLPYPTYEMGAKAVETLDTEEYYGIYATPMEEGKEDDLMDAYVAALTSAGWRKEGSGYIYYIDGHALTLSVSIYDGAVLIYLYTPTATDALTTLIRGKLALNPNSTVSFAITDTTYSGYGTADQQVTSQKTTDYYYEWDANSAHAKMTVDGELARDDYYIPEGEKVYQYSYLSGSLKYVENWNSLRVSNLFTWYDFYTSELIGITDLGDGAFTVSGEALDRILIIMTQYAEEYTGDDFGSMKVFYDEEAGILTGTATKSTAQGSLTRVLTLSLTISDIGTTEIDFPSK